MRNYPAGVDWPEGAVAFSHDSLALRWACGGAGRCYELGSDQVRGTFNPAGQLDELEPAAGGIMLGRGVAAPVWPGPVEFLQAWDVATRQPVEVPVE